jgi:AbrB family looped-hinge helix DNA binding protein
LAQTVKIIEGGKLVIPAKMRKEMGIGRGDSVVVELLPDGDLRVRPLAAAVKRAQAIVRGFVKGEGSLVDELIAERRAEGKRE